jgi:phosphatidylglycerol:prolipoprotein diacylglycerol transferase
LVVYGSVMGGAAAVLWFARRYRLPLLAIGDLLAPSMMLGLAFGRIGCFLNGCCWGGQCDPSALGVTFPQGSPPFVDQVKNGTLLDMRLERQSDGTYHVRNVEAGGLAARAGLQPGDEILQIALPEEDVFNRLRHGEEANAALLSLTLSDGRRISWELGDLPRRSAPVYPVQVFSSINAALICLFLWSSYPFRRRDGEVLAWMLTLYPITRFLLEWIRSDEASVLETGFKITISQTISLLILVAVTGLWIYLLRQPRGSALPLAAPDGNGHVPHPAGSPSSV